MKIRPLSNKLELFLSIVAVIIAYIVGIYVLYLSLSSCGWQC